MISIRGLRCRSPWLVGIGLILASTSNAFSQTRYPDLEEYSNRLAGRVAQASDAARVVQDADVYRRDARTAMNSGNRIEAERLLNAVNEFIAAAIAKDGIRPDEPLLLRYMQDIQTDLVALRPELQALPAPSKDEDTPIHPSVLAAMDYFSGRGNATIEVSRERLTAYLPMMRRVFREEAVPEWLIAVGAVESAYDPTAVSDKGALGIWQFVPETAARYGLLQVRGSDQRFNPEKSTRAAARYLRDLFADFGDWPLSLAAYNTGEGRIAQIISRTGVHDFWTMADQRLLPDETSNYVPSVLAAARFLNDRGTFSEGVTPGANECSRVSTQPTPEHKPPDTPHFGVSKTINNGGTDD